MDGPEFGLGALPFGDPASWEAGTLDTRLSDWELYWKLQQGYSYYELGIDAQTADSLSDAIEATLRGSR